MPRRKKALKTFASKEERQLKKKVQPKKIYRKNRPTPILSNPLLFISPLTNITPPRQESIITSSQINNQNAVYQEELNKLKKMMVVQDMINKEDIRQVKEQFEESISSLNKRSKKSSSPNVFRWEKNTEAPVVGLMKKKMTRRKIEIEDDK
jgi:hypothetical protein